MRLEAKILRTLLVALVLAANGPAVAAEGAHAHDHGAAPARLQLDHGRKWATDEPLRKGMSAIRAAMAAQLEKIHRGSLDAEGYRKLGAGVEAQIGSIVAQCKLKPEADAMLHLVIADLSAGADAMQGRSDAAPAEGAQHVVHALHDYGNYFRHPGWKPLH